jgi:hypothetical protein
VLTNDRAHLGWVDFTVVLLGTVGPAAPAQSSEWSRKAVTLEESLDVALKNRAAVCAPLDRVTAAQAGVGLARTNYLPRADLVWQTDRATGNNNAGLLFPQSIFALIFGPVPAWPSNRSAGGSAAGLVLSRKPLDLGCPGAKVDATGAVRNGATAETSMTLLPDSSVEVRGSSLFAPGAP